jgi:hypothetical protein
MYEMYWNPKSAPCITVYQKRVFTMKSLMITAAVGTCLIFAPMAQADSFIIDNFVSPPEGQIVEVTGTGTAGPTTSTGLVEVIGGSRTLEITATATLADQQVNNPSSLVVSPQLPGSMSFNNGSGQNADGFITWDNAGAGLGGIDITNGGANPFLQTTILLSDQDLGFRMDITDTNGFTAFWTTSLGSGISFVNEALANFTNAASVDFTSVDSMMLTLSGPTAQDTTLALIEVTNTPLGTTIIPEPSALALLGFGALAMLRRRHTA